MVWLSKNLAAENLGIYFAGGRSRGTFFKKSTAVKRVQSVKARMNRMARLSRAAKATAPKVFNTCLHSALASGAEVQGFDNQQIRDFQHMQLTSLGLFGKGKSRSLSLALNEGRAWEPATAPIQVWAKVVWNSATKQPGERFTPSLRTLFDWWRRAQANPPSNWTTCKGPFGAMRLSMLRLGWASTGPFSFQDARGQGHAILTLGPTLASALAKRDWMDALHGKASSSLGMQGKDIVDLYRARKLPLGKKPLTSLERCTIISFLVQGS